jgi:hypothetical protein
MENGDAWWTLNESIETPQVYNRSRYYYLRRLVNETIDVVWGASGMCVCDAQWTFLNARTIWYDRLPPPLETKALVLRDTIIWFGDMRVSNVSIIIDSTLLVVNVIVDN